MRLRMSEVLDRLKAEGLATNDTDEAVRAALAADAADDMPWYVRVAVGLGAYLATGFLIGSLMSIVGLNDEVVRLVFGALLVALSVYIRRRATAEFVRQGTVAASFAGQAFVIFGIAELSHSMLSTGLAAAVISAALIWLMPDRIHRFLSAIVGAVALTVAVFDLDQPYAFEIAILLLVALTAYVWRSDVRNRDQSVDEMLAPVGYGLMIAVFALLLFAAGTALGSRHMDVRLMRMILGPVTTIGITAAFVALVWKIIDDLGIPLNSGMAVAALVGAVALGAGALSSPGVVAGAAALMLAFDRRDKVLLGVAVIFLLAFASVYYYSLNLTLLEKSGVLIGSGVLLLAIRSRLAPRDHEGVAAA